MATRTQIPTDKTFDVSLSQEGGGGPLSNRNSKNIHNSFFPTESKEPSPEPGSRLWIPPNTTSSSLPVRNKTMKRWLCCVLSLRILSIMTGNDPLDAPWRFFSFFLFGKIWQQWIFLNAWHVQKLPRNYLKMSRIKMCRSLKNKRNKDGARREAPAMCRIIALIAETRRSSEHAGLQWPLAEALRSVTQLHFSEKADGQNRRTTRSNARSRLLCPPWRCNQSLTRLRVNVWLWSRIEHEMSTQERESKQ